MDWSLSESSDSGSDEDRPVTRLRMDRDVFLQYLQNCWHENWPDENQHRNYERQLPPPPPPQNHFNGWHRNERSFDNTSLDGSSYTSDANQSHRFFDRPSDNIILLEEGGRFRPIRVITSHDLAGHWNMQPPNVRKIFLLFRCSSRFFVH